MLSKWRRFLPGKRAESKFPTSLPGSNRLSTIRSLDDANNFVAQLKAQSEPKDQIDKQEYYRTLVLAQTPKAVLAQIQMDKHKHGYRNREKRLYELIDFNDSFVSYVLATPHAQLPGLAEKLQVDMTTLCRKLDTPMFTNLQFEAIVRGLSREIAVYRGSLHRGFKARMTNRTEDAFGIDMVITQPETGKTLNIDCKTPPAFRHRMEDLLKDGRITEQQLLAADEADFITTEHRRNDERVNVTMLCIRPDTLGEIIDFTFTDTAPLALLLNKVFDSIS